MSELIDVIDEDGKFTGEILSKTKMHERGLWHKTVHVWIYTKQGKVLMQLRAKTKNLFPNVWDVSAAGHVHAGEDVRVAACRELREELGLSLQLSDLEEVLVKKAEYPVPGWKKQHREFVTVYFYRAEEQSFNIQKEEVAATAFIDLKTFRSELKDQTKRRKYVSVNENYFIKIISMIEKKLTQ